MSARTRIMTGTLVDSATVTASSSAAGLPATNVQNELRTKVHRFTGCTSEYYRVDLGSAQSMNALCLVNHNLTASAVVTLKAGTSPGDGSLLSETFDAWTPIIGYGQNWGLNYGGYLSPAEIATYFPAGTLLIHYMASVNARYWEIGLADADNQDGYLECGRLILDWYRTSERGVAVGLSNTPQDPSPVAYSLGGQAWKDAKTKFRENVYQFPYVPGAETWATWFKFVQEVGVGRSFVIDGLYGTTNLTAGYHNQLYAHIPEGGIQPIAVPILDLGTINLTVRESR